MKRITMVLLAMLMAASLSAQTKEKKKSSDQTKKKSTAASTKKKAAPASAQRRPVTDAVTVRARQRKEATVDLRLNSWFFENFFQAPKGTPEEDMLAASIEGRFTRPLPFEFQRNQPVEGYLYLEYMHFDEESFGGSPGLRVGARTEGRPHSWDGSAQLQMDRPAFDVGDQPDQADIARLSGDYAYRLGRDWQLGAGVDFDKQSFDVSQQRDNDFLGVGGSIRYRGFGSEFSPEVGFAVGNRSVDDATEDYGQRDWFLQIRSAPSPPLYLSARYRHRMRDYDTSVVTSTNFQREDTRDQIVLAADLRSGARLTWNFYLAWEDADSTKESRIFDTLLATFGLTYRLK